MKKIIFKLINVILKDFKNLNDQIIVQEHIYNVQLSGVISTRDLTSRAPYYIINYDKSSKTD